MSEPQELQIQVLGASSADTDRRTAELESSLRLLSPDIEVQRLKTDPESMDLGSLLQIIAGSAAMDAIAQGVARWLGKRQDAAIIIKTRDGSIEATKITSGDAVRILEIVQRARRTR